MISKRSDIKVPDTNSEELTKEITYERWRKSGVRPTEPMKYKVKKVRTESHKITIPALQCNGVTKSGSICKNKTKNSSGYCHHH